jgi:hypothetical protein
MPKMKISLPRPHDEQRRFLTSPAKRKIIRAGRRGGKTVGMAIYSVEKFLAGKRVLYTTPTSEQIQRFWAETTRALAEPIAAGVFAVNQTWHTIELPGTEQRIRAKTAWNADTLRGDYGDELIFDEYQLMDETAWSEVGAPMLLDNDGNARLSIPRPPCAAVAHRRRGIPSMPRRCTKRRLLTLPGAGLYFILPPLPTRT